MTGQKSLDECISPFDDSRISSELTRTSRITRDRGEKPRAWLSCEIFKLPADLPLVAYCARVEVLRDDQVISSAEAWTYWAHYGNGRASTPSFAADLSSVMARWESASAEELDRWTIRVSGVPELSSPPSSVLRDQTATHYWSGSVTLKLSDILDRPDQSPRIAGTYSTSTREPWW